MGDHDQLGWVSRPLNLEGMVGGAAMSYSSYSTLLSNDPKPADNAGFGPVMIGSQESPGPSVYNIHIA